MAIKYVQRPFTITTSNSSSASLTQETGETADRRIICARTVTDDGAGAFIAGMGTVDYVGKRASLKVVSHDRSSSAYKSDYEDAKAFERVVTDGSGSGNSDTKKGGAYGTASVGEEMLGGSSIVARYRVGAGVPVHRSQTFTPPAVVLDLCPYTSQRIVAGSVMFRWLGSIYSDFDGVIYRDRTETDPGVASGWVDYDGGTALMTDYVAGGTGPTDFQLMSLWTQAGQWSTACLFFTTEAAPLQAGAGGFVLTVVDTKGTTLTANVDAQGNITGLHMRGKIEFSRGGVELLFGDYVLDTELTPAQKLEWWYNAADIGAVQPGRIWRPWPVDPTTLRYSCVSFIYLPVDVSLMGIDPAALPPDGRVAFARPGDTCVIGVKHGGVEFAPSVGMVYNIGHERLSLVQVLGSDGAEIYDGYTVDLDAGEVTFTDLAGYPPLVKVVARTEVYRQIAEVRIDGKVKLTQPIGYAFPAGAVFSTALRQGDRFARVSRVYSQVSWKGVWYDGVDPSIGEAVGKYRHDEVPIEVTNLGAITERWLMRFRADRTTFDLIGQRLGQIASGNVNEDFAPINPATGVPYMVVRALGWSQGQIEGTAHFVDTVGAEAPIELVRCTQPSSPAGPDDSFWIVQRGSVGKAPESSFN